MEIHIHDNAAMLGAAAAREAAARIRSAIERKGKAVIIVATGASQFDMFDTLVTEDIDWSKVTAFHLDEYVGIGADHPASFRNYLRKRFIERLGSDIRFEPVNGDATDLDAELERLAALIRDEVVDLCFAGIGENCHLAFNDPPADFETQAPFILVSLDEACRRQQMGEGWFASLDEVPQRAISMSIQQIMKSAELVLSVPDLRKAQAVQHAVEGPVSNLAPASIIQRHERCVLHLDRQSASMLSPQPA